MDGIADQDDVARLRDFLRDRDVPCPMCRYNLRDLTRPRCPECLHELQVTVGVTRPRFLWFLLAVAPCMFAGIAAAILAIVSIFQMIAGGQPPHPFIIALDALGWLSALGGSVLVRKRFAFLRRTPARQRLLAVAVWALHLLGFFTWFGTILVLTGGP